MIPVVALLVLVSWFYQLKSLRLGLRRLRRRAIDRDVAMPPISILKPVCGDEAGLEKNLEAFFQLDYPNFEILVCSERVDDPALDTARRLQLKYPQVRTRIVPEGKTLGANPKINTVGKAFGLAANDWILISDANVRPSADFLLALAHGIADGSDMQSGVLRGIKASNRAGRVEALFYELFYAKAMWLLDAAGSPCASAKCLFFRRSVADSFGGLKAIADYHADDVRLSRLMSMNGKRVALVDSPVPVFIGSPRWHSVWARQVRWAKNRRVLFLPGFIAEPLSSPFFAGTLLTFVSYPAMGLAPSFAVPLHLMAWAISDLLLLSRQGIPVGPATLIDWLCMESFRVLVWVASIFGHLVVWRDHTFQLGPGGKLIPQKAFTP